MYNDPKQGVVMKQQIAFFTFIFSIFLSACLSTNSVQKIAKDWVLDNNGYIQYYTIDPVERNGGKFYFVENIQNKNIYEVEVRKISGSRSGYGISLCLEPENLQERYSFIINIDGFFHIGKNHNGGSEKIMDDWIKSEYINTGYDTSNIIKVVREENIYTFYVNGNILFSFTDSDIDAKFLAYGLDISADENFPDVPVDIRFKYINN
jgi:hypothetical protein